MVDARVRGCYEGIATGGRDRSGAGGEWFGWLGRGRRPRRPISRAVPAWARGKRRVPIWVRHQACGGGSQPFRVRCTVHGPGYFCLFDTSPSLFLSLGFCVGPFLVFLFPQKRRTYGHRHIDTCRCPSGCIFDEECFSVSMLVSRER